MRVPGRLLMPAAAAGVHPTAEAARIFHLIDHMQR